MEGNNQMEFCKAQMITIVEHYLKTVLMKDVKFEVRDVGYSQNTFTIKLGESTDKEGDGKRKKINFNSRTTEKRENNMGKGTEPPNS